MQKKTKSCMSFSKNVKVTQETILKAGYSVTCGLKIIRKTIV